MRPWAWPGGSTLSAVSRHLAKKSMHGSVIVQLNGAGNMHTTGISYARDIMRRFGSAYDARHLITFDDDAAA